MWTQILTALLVGLLMAFAFQLWLTSFGVAIGLTTWGMRLGAADESDAQPADPNSSDVSTTADQSRSKTGAIAGLGLLLSINLVLFGACFLATRFSQISSPTSGAVAGIVIWSAYFLILTWVSVTTVGSLLGSVLTVATGGFRQLIATIATALKPEEEEPLRQEEAIAIVRQEIQQALSPVVLSEIVNQTSDQPIAAPPETLPGSAFEERADLDERLWQKFESYLRYTSTKRLTPEQVRNKVEMLLNEALQTAGDRAQFLEFDAAKVKTLLKRRKGLDKRQRRQILQQIESTWSARMELLKAAFQPDDELNDNRFQPLESLQSIKTYAAESLQELSDKLPIENIDLEAILRKSLPSGETIASAATLAVLRQLNQIDWEAVFDRLPLHALKPGQIEQVATEVRSTAQALVSKPQHWTEDHLLPQAQDLKDQALQQVDRLQQTMQQQMDTLKAKAQRRLDNTRKAAATAAWWLSATAFTAALSAALSGALAAGMQLPVHLVLKAIDF